MSNAPQVLTVSQLTGRLKDALEEAFPAVWVGGEVSNLRRQQSGHLYFTLKDEGATLGAVVWRSTASRLRFDLADGQQVICQGGLEIYPPHGKYQLVVRQMEPTGLGALQLAFRQLHEKILAEGLFDARWKKPLPRFPRRIAFVTSPTGAAARDFLEVVRRRWNGVHVLIIPARVQGVGAAAEIAAGIARANALADPPDVLVVGRGGGSLEDLWCFNEEVVVRAIFASRIPVVSAVGHEIDISLADLVADVRALTPSEAAERVVPSGDEIRAGLRHFGQRLFAALRSRAADARTRLSSLARRRGLRRPLDLVHERARRLDELESRAARAVRHASERAAARLSTVAARLDSLSPLAVLGRGYAIAQRVHDGSVIRSAAGLTIGEQMLTRFADGSAYSRVEGITRE